MEDKLELGKITFVENCNLGNCIETIDNNINYLSSVKQRLTNYYDGYNIKTILKIFSLLTYQVERCNCCKNRYVENTYIFCNLEEDSCSEGSKFKLDITKVIDEYDIKL